MFGKKASTLKHIYGMTFSGSTNFYETSGKRDDKIEICLKINMFKKSLVIYPLSKILSTSSDVRCTCTHRFETETRTAMHTKTTVL